MTATVHGGGGGSGGNFSHPPGPPPNQPPFQQQRMMVPPNGPPPMQQQHFQQQQQHQIYNQGGGGGGGGGSGPPLNFRVILNRDEVAFLFGFDGVLLNQLRQQTGANLMLTDPQGGHEQVLTIAGPLDLIFKAFSLICRKLWDFLQSLGGQQMLLIRLAVPASQCGSIIGKHGAKVKEIRDLTGANIQVSQESLPDSTERCVEVSGTGESCLQCAYHICCVLQEAPLRGELIPYVPKGPGDGMQQPQQDDGFKPVFLCGDKAYVIEGEFAVPAPPELLRRELAQTPLGDMTESLELLKNGQQQQQQIPDHMNPLSLMQAISNAQRKQGSAQPQTTRSVPVTSAVADDLVATNKMAEIRRISGAQVSVSDGPANANGDKTLMVSGTEEAILLAQFLVQSNVDMFAKKHETSTATEQTSAAHPPPPQAFENGGGAGSSQSARQKNDPRLRGRSGTSGGFGNRS